MINKSNIHISVPDHIRLNNKNDKAEWLKEPIANYLKHGKENAVTNDELEEVLGIRCHKTQENIRHAIKLLLADGLPVVSGAKGSYYATEASELEAMKESFQIRIKGHERTIRMIEDAIELNFGKPKQKEMF